jgi:hypothetical protein
MATIHPGRYTAEVDGDFVVFLIGMRLNRPWKLHHWWPVFAGMRHMLAELARHPERGLLGFSTGLLNGGPAVVQYWRSFEHIERCARDPGDLHPAGVALVQPGGDGLGRRRHLARDLPRPGRAVRGHLRQHAPDRAGRRRRPSPHRQAGRVGGRAGRYHGEGRGGGLDLNWEFRKVAWRRRSRRSHGHRLLAFFLPLSGKNFTRQ